MILFYDMQNTYVYVEKNIDIIRNQVISMLHDRVLPFKCTAKEKQNV